jgi:hypothetical protein
MIKFLQLSFFVLYACNVYAQNYDLKMNKAIEPQSVGCYNNANGKLIISVTGLGNDSFSMSDILYLGAEVTSPSSSKTTYGPVIISGIEIKKDSSKIFTITSSLNLTEIGTYSIRTIVYWAKDIDHTNDTMTSTILVNKPTLKLSAITKNHVCTNDSLKLSVAASIGASSIQWYRNSAPLSSGMNLDYWVKNFGVYQCIITNVSGCEDTSNPITISLKSAPSASFSNIKNGFCKNDSVMLYSIKNSMYAYQWYKNNAPISGFIDTFIIIKNVGLYSLKVIDTATQCFSISFSKYIDSFATPVVMINPMTSNICIGDSVKLMASFKTNFTYTWKNNGTNLIGKDSFYFAKMNGSYIVNVKDTSTGCIASSNVSIITASPKPTATFNIVGPALVCAMDSVKMKASFVSNASYQWLLNGSEIPGAMDTMYNAIMSGNYSLKVTTNITGCFSHSKAKLATIQNPINAKINYAGNPTICFNSTTVLNADTNSNFNSTYQWYKNNVSIPSATSSSMTVSTTDIYKVKVMKNGCESITSNFYITIEGKIDTSLSINGLLYGCANNTILTAKLDTNMIYKWYDGVTPLSETSNVFSIPASGNFFVKILSKISGCIVQSKAVNASYTMTMKSPSISSLKSNICDQDSVLISIANIDTAISTYTWYRDNVLEYSSSLPLYYAAKSGFYTLRLYNKYGCIAQTQSAVSINIYPLPTPVISTSKTGGCIGDSVKLSLDNITGIVTMQWSKDNQIIPNAILDNYKVKTSGLYTIKVSDVYGCEATSPERKMTFGSKPTPVISYNSNTKMLQTTSYASYKWSDNGGDIVGATSSSLQPLYSSTYFVVVSDSVGCEGKSAGFYYSYLNIKELSKSTFQIFPNPASEYFTLKNTSDITFEKLELYNLRGQKILTINMIADLSIYDISSLEKGTYICIGISKNEKVILDQFIVK